MQNAHFKTVCWIKTFVVAAWSIIWNYMCEHTATNYCSVDWKKTFYMILRRNEYVFRLFALLLLSPFVYSLCFIVAFVCVWRYTYIIYIAQYSETRAWVFCIYSEFMLKHNCSCIQFRFELTLENNDNWARCFVAYIYMGIDSVFISLLFTVWEYIYIPIIIYQLIGNFETSHFFVYIKTISRNQSN